MGAAWAWHGHGIGHGMGTAWEGTGMAWDKHTATGAQHGEDMGTTLEGQGDGVGRRGED